MAYKEKSVSRSSLFAFFIVWIRIRNTDPDPQSC